MTDSPAGVIAWRAEIEKLENACYWPGPRPMREADREARADQMMGRDVDTEDIVYEIRDHGLTVLLGETGVGKSSLLELKVRPHLVNEGFTVLVCNQWSSAGDELQPEDIDGFVSARISSGLPEGVKPGVAFAQQLHEHFGHRAVLILDQFEEIIRHQPRLLGLLQKWIVDCVTSYNIRVVISMRTEYGHHLRGLDVGAFQRIDLELTPLRELETILQIVESGRDPDRPGSPVISREAAEAIASLWQQAGGGDPWSGVGLLHLQALLYVLWDSSTGDDIGVHDLNEVVQQTGVPGELGSPAEAARHVFDTALAQSVALRLDRCSTVFVDNLRGDRMLADGARTLVKRMAKHLSSGGYKVDQDRWELAQLVLADELSILGADLDEMTTRARFLAIAALVDAQRTNDAAADWLAVDRAVLVPDLVEDVDDWPWDADPSNVTSGPMMGISPQAVVIEEFRRFFFALEWLTVNGQVRWTSLSERNTMLSLTHDGIGRGLVDWARHDSARPREFFDLLVGAIGKSIRVAEPIDGLVDESAQFAVNLRWTSCLITATFRHVTFVNCDFRNSTFVRCNFEGVTFVNCLLDGVSLIECDFVGSVSDSMTAGREGPPTHPLSFRVALPPEAEAIVSALNRYRGMKNAVTTNALYSQIAGLPALPSRGEEALSVEVASRGVVIYGGRQSSLVFADCKFPDGGRVAFRDLEGTSLEFADQAVADIELRNVTLRGLTISAPLGVKPRPPGGVQVRAYASTLQNVWISARLEGSLVLDSVDVWQLANVSEKLTVTRSGDLSKAYRGDLDLASDLENLAAIALRVDFRTIPAKREILLRESDEPV